MSTERYRDEVTRLVEAGWRIEDETPERVVLVDRDYGDPTVHVLLAVLTLWWSFGAVNLLYGLYRYLATAERTVVWKDGRAGGGTEAGENAGAEKHAS